MPHSIHSPLNMPQNFSPSADDHITNAGLEPCKTKKMRTSTTITYYCIYAGFENFHCVIHYDVLNAQAELYRRVSGRTTLRVVTCTEYFGFKRIIFSIQFQTSFKIFRLHVWNSVLQMEYSRNTVHTHSK